MLLSVLFAGYSGDLPPRRKIAVPPLSVLEAMRTPAPAEVLAKYRQLREGNVEVDEALVCDAEMGGDDETSKYEAEGEKATPADQPGAYSLCSLVTYMVDFMLVEIREMGGVVNPGVWIVVFYDDDLVICEVILLLDFGGGR